MCCSCMFILHSRFSPQSESDKSFALKIVALLPLLFRVSPLLPLHSALVAELGDAFEAPATHGIGRAEAVSDREEGCAPEGG